MTELLQSALAHYSVGELLAIAAVLGLGSVIQGAVGFASGLFAIPLLVMGGVALPEAAAINFLLTSMQNVVGAWRLRHEINLREAALPVVSRWVGLPLGAVAMKAAAGLDPAVTKQAIGAMLLAMVIALWGWQVKHRDRLPSPVTFGAFALSGFLLGFASIGGAPMVLYVNSLNWSAAKCRAFLFFASASGAPLMAGLLIWNFGFELLPACLAALFALPFCWLGVHTGIRLGMRLNKPLFRRITYSLLTVIAISSLLTPWLSAV